MKCMIRFYTTWPYNSLIRTEWSNKNHVIPHKKETVNINDIVYEVVNVCYSYGMEDDYPVWVDVMLREKDYQKEWWEQLVKVEDIETMGWRKAVKGMRNPLNSWNRSDSGTGCSHRNTWAGEKSGTLLCKDCGVSYDSKCVCTGTDKGFKLGPNDLDLAYRLIKAGPEHRKFLRMIHIQMDITAPLYWWKEMDTYKVATVANSCSTMHKIHSKEFELSDFSYENLFGTNIEVLEGIIKQLNFNRYHYLETKDKKYWWQLIQLLPSSYNQLRTWDGTMETVLSIIHHRLHHKLDTDWGPFCQACFDNIPYCKEFYESMYGKEEN